LAGFSFLAVAPRFIQGKSPPGRPSRRINPPDAGTDAILAAGRIGSEPHDDLTQA
jgi:hypothetical protein